MYPHTSMKNSILFHSIHFKIVKYGSHVWKTGVLLCKKKWGAINIQTSKRAFLRGWLGLGKQPGMRRGEVVPVETEADSVDSVPFGDLLVLVISKSTQYGTRRTMCWVVKSQKWGQRGLIIMERSCGQSCRVRHLGDGVGSDLVEEPGTWLKDLWE